jgi:GNAT superfamily N-acetyltransferase
MKLYHHYKNKPYTYVGLARHSETLEEMVIYETRYENERGSVIAPLIEKSFGQWDSKWFYTTFSKHKKFHLAIAYIEGQPVGFKIGYERDQNEFYSWLGGVLPEYRGLGVAGDLMNAQHEWCRKQGYSKIGTKTQNRFKAMLMLNIKNGFEIIGTDPTDKDGMKILMEKRINGN